MSTKDYPGSRTRPRSSTQRTRVTFDDQLLAKLGIAHAVQGRRVQATTPSGASRRQVLAALSRIAHDDQGATRAGLADLAARGLITISQDSVVQLTAAGWRHLYRLCGI